MADVEADSLGYVLNQLFIYLGNQFAFKNINVWLCINHRLRWTSVLNLVLLHVMRNFDAKTCPTVVYWFLPPLSLYVGEIHNKSLKIALWSRIHILAKSCVLAAFRGDVVSEALFCYYLQARFKGTEMATRKLRSLPPCSFAQISWRVMFHLVSYKLLKFGCCLMLLCFKVICTHTLLCSDCADWLLLKLN